MRGSFWVLLPAGWRRTWPALVLLSLTAAVFWRVLFVGEGLSADGSLAAWQPWADTRLAVAPPPGNELLLDQYAFLNPNEEFISRWVRRGVWPLWNPDLAHGLPLDASITNAQYYPTNLLLWAIPPFWSRGLRALLRVGLCLIGTYAFGRLIGMRRAGATLAAMSFAFCGFNVVWLGHPQTNVSFLLPCILWTLERTLQTGAFKWGVGLTLGAGAALLGGHPPTVFHISVIVAIWLAYRQLVSTTDPAPRLACRALGWRLALCALGAGLIGSAAVLPWTRYLAQNPGAILFLRHGRTLSWGTLVAWLVPDFFGNAMVSEWNWAGRLYHLPGWENYAERTGYVGIASLFLALGMVFSRPFAHRLLPWGLGIAVSLVLIYDPPIVGELARGLPGFHAVRNSRMICVAGFCLAILAGFGCDRLLTRRDAFARAVSGWAAVALASAVLIVALWPDAAGWRWIAEIGAREQFQRDCAWTLIPALAVLAALVLARSGRRSAAIVLVLGVAMIDLWRFGTGFNPTLARRHAAPATGGIRYLQKRASEMRVLPIGRRFLPGNTLLRYGLADVRGGDWVNVRHYEFLLTGRTGHFDFGARLQRVPRTFAALNVSHVAFAKGMPLPPAARVVYDDDMRIVAVADPLPRALLVHDVRLVENDAEARQLIAGRRADMHHTVLVSRADWGAGHPTGVAPGDGEQVRVTDASPNEVRLRLDARTPGIVVLMDTFFPGWQCRVDGRSAPIMRANVAFRAVAVPAGSHELTFRYRPWRALLGLGLAGMTLAVIVGAALGRRSGCLAAFVPHPRD